MKWFYKWLNKKITDANAVSDTEASEDRPDSPDFANLANWNSGMNPTKVKRSLKIQSSVGAYAPMANSIDRSAVQASEHLHSTSTNFKLYNANGGMVVELRRYDEKQDTEHMSLYILHGDKDMAEQIAHIITVEALKR